MTAYLGWAGPNLLEQQPPTLRTILDSSALYLIHFGTQIPKVRHNDSVPSS